MAKLVFGMNQSLDGYVDHMAFGPSPALFRHFIAEAQAQTGSIYGRRMYEIMRYWDDEHPDWYFSCAKAAGFRTVEFSWILEDNLDLLKPIEVFEGRLYRRYRLVARTVPSAS